MKNRIVALVIEAKKSDLKQQFCFHPSMFSEILSGLKMVYDEVFVWSAEHHLIVWIVGNDVSFLTQFFDSYRYEFEKLHLQEGMMAQQLFKKVGEGKMWNDVNTMKKRDTLQYAYELAHEENSLGPTLFPFVSGSLSHLRNLSLIYGPRHSKSYHKDKAALSGTPVVNIKSKDIFYRFCIN